MSWSYCHICEKWEEKKCTVQQGSVFHNMVWSGKALPTIDRGQLFCTAHEGDYFGVLFSE